MLPGCPKRPRAATSPFAPRLYFPKSLVPTSRRWFPSLRKRDATTSLFAPLPKSVASPSDPPPPSRRRQCRQDGERKREATTAPRSSTTTRRRPAAARSPRRRSPPLPMQRSRYCISPLSFLNPSFLPPIFDPTKENQNPKQTLSFPLLRPCHPQALPADPLRLLLQQDPRRPHLPQPVRRRKPQKYPSDRPQTPFPARHLQALRGRAGLRQRPPPEMLEIVHEAEQGQVRPRRVQPCNRGVEGAASHSVAGPGEAGRPCVLRW